jgi:hypothetical protein
MECNIANYFYANYLNFIHLQVISKEQGQALANEYGIKFLETSAKSNINVEEAFFTLARYDDIFSSFNSPVKCIKSPFSCK